MLLDGHRIVCASFDGSIVCDDHTSDTLNGTNASDYASSSYLVLVHLIGSQGRKLQERATWVYQRRDSISCQQFPPLKVFVPRLFWSTTDNLFMEFGVSCH